MPKRPPYDGSFVFSSDGFVYREVQYPYSRVINLGFLERKQRSPIGVGTPLTHEIFLKIFLAEGPELILEDTLRSRRIFEIESEARINEIRNVYRRLARETFKYRGQPYFQHFRTEGFFRYSGWELHPEPHQFRFNDRIYNMSQHTLKRHLTGIELRPTKESVAEKTRRFFGSEGYPNIHTLMDTDFFYAILRKYFQLP